MKDLVYFSCKIDKDTLTLYGAGKFAEEKLILNRDQCRLLFIELWKFLKFDNNFDKYSKEDLINAWCGGYNKAVSSINENRYDEEDNSPTFEQWFNNLNNK